MGPIGPEKSRENLWPKMKTETIVNKLGLLKKTSYSSLKRVEFPKATNQYDTWEEIEQI